MSIPYMDGTFDFVVSSYALHHLTGEQKILLCRKCNARLNLMDVFASWI
ncbi:MAG: class I SAM-dependent methyltransferase [Bacillota bacterium]